MSTMQTRTISPELHQAIGEVPIDRIRMIPIPGTATEADYLALVNQDIGCELVDGVIVKKPMAFQESAIAAYLIIMMGQYVLAHRLGIITTEKGTIRFSAKQQREPDVAFTSWDRFPPDGVSSDAISKVIPNLCVEVLSPSNNRKEMKIKREVYFQAGVELVWMVDPDSETVDVYTSEGDFTTLTNADMLDGGVVLPSFTLPVANLFTVGQRPSASGGKP